MKEKSERLIPRFIIAGFVLFFLGGIFGGAIAEPKSILQMISWQIGNAGAICGAVLAGSLLTKQEWHLPSAGFVILGIVHGINYASILMNDIDERVFITSAIVIVPSILMINFYTVFHFWLRIIGWIACIIFLIMYYRMIKGVFVYGEWSQVWAYFLEQVAMMGWCYYFWRENIRKPSPDSN